MDDAMHELGRRLELASAADMAALAEWVSVHAPERGARAVPMAGGVVALTGRGMYVNCAIGSALDEPLTSADLDELEALCASVDAPSTIEVASGLTHPDAVPLLDSRGYRPGDSVRSSKIQSLVGAQMIEETGDFRIEVVESCAQLAQWQEAAALGWGHTTPERRATSDLFGAGAHATQTPGLLLVHDPSDGRVVGSSALSITDGVGTLGGMSTVPDERNRGVQQYCLAHRVNLAIEAGCTLATVQAAPDSGSLRNIERPSAGFAASHVTTGWVLD